MLEEWHTKLITLIPREGTETVTCSIPQNTQVAELITLIPREGTETCDITQDSKELDTLALITLIPREGTETRAVHVQHLLEHLR